MASKDKDEHGTILFHKITATDIALDVITYSKHVPLIIAVIIPHEAFSPGQPSLQIMSILGILLFDASPPVLF